MSGAYAPHWRRGEAGGESGYAATGGPPITTINSQGPPDGYRGGRGGRAGRGGRWGRGGRGGRGNRGRRGGFQNDFFQKKPDFDDAELVHLREVARHFWPGDESALEASALKSTFHDSEAQNGQLSYMTLFYGANPRWTSDHIVFAKSRLNLLPEYGAKKAEHGDWEIPEATDLHGPGSEHLGEGQGEPATADQTTAGNGLHGHEAESIPQESASLTAQDVDIQGAGGDGKLQVGIAPETADTTSAATATATADANADAVTDATSDTARTGKDEPEAIHTAAKSPDTGNDGSNIHAENGATDSQSYPNEGFRMSSRLKYTDIRTIPAVDYYSKEEAPPVEPSFPNIPPIDYTPASQSPTAVFEEVRKMDDLNGRTLLFKGWFRVTRINLLAPKSAELVRMQNQKWERRDRYGNPMPARRRDIAKSPSLDVEWAVVKFEPLPEGEAPAKPNIERFPDEPTGEDESVSEKLSKIRLEDQTEENSAGDAAASGPADDTASVTGGATADDTVDVAVETTANGAANAAVAAGKE
ncbi:hypothetical protein GGR56DRAFT_640806 [Xylariaceae sp. FL0804]|nr:hypothetical protein GGR56DRAFT_640806 [Xylariaceae sp. FL0804]